jgi:hypothetical protein
VVVVEIGLVVLELANLVALAAVAVVKVLGDQEEMVIEVRQIVLLLHKEVMVVLAAPLLLKDLVEVVDILK